MPESSVASSRMTARCRFSRSLPINPIGMALPEPPAQSAHFSRQPGIQQDTVRAIHQHAGRKFLDYAVVNIRPIPSAVKKRYAREAALPVENDIDAIYQMGLKVMAGNLAQHTGKVRHDPAATAAVVPSPTAFVICLVSCWRTSPIAKSPGIEVSIF